MKEISKDKMQKLIDKHVIRNTVSGFVDRQNRVIGFYRTKNKRYIEDKYANWDFDYKPRRGQKSSRRK